MSHLPKSHTRALQRRSAKLQGPRAEEGKSKGLAAPLVSISRTKEGPDNYELGTRCDPNHVRIIQSQGTESPWTTGERGKVNIDGGYRYEEARFPFVNM